MTMQRSIAFFALLAPLTPLSAANSAPEAVPIVDTIPSARDVPWPGTIELSVDTTDVVHGVFQVTEIVPVAEAGPLTLLYPQWLPGNHAPNGPIPELADLRITGAGGPLKWKRDPVDVYAFHMDVPAGTTSLKVEFQFLAATDAVQGRIVTTPDMLNLEWNAVVLYPAGFYVRRIAVEASLRVPDGWRAASALEVASQVGSIIRYQPTTLDTLVDSPVFAGANVRVEGLAPGVRLNIVADRPEELAATSDQIQLFRNLVVQAVRVFGSQHYDHYDFLLALSDRQSGVGLEHHRCSENGVIGKYFIDWKDTASNRDLLPHEYTHSWNGKFRRPADLWTPDYRTPMQDSLLWVYEGQTQFWGYVLGARSGLLSKSDALAALGAIAATYDTRIGRTWRPLIDTTNDPVISQRRPRPWVSWQRSEDYYNEGLLVWLDADSLIRQLSGGARSIDDFAKAFFGVNDRDWGELTYTFDDIVAALNGVQPYDWARFLRDRLENTSQHAPLDGLGRGGYQLIYTDTPSDWFKSYEKLRKVTDLSYSGGIALGKNGEITGVVWDSPAFDAGLTVGTTLIAVDGRAYDVDDLKETIKSKKSPVSLLVRTGDIFRTVVLNYDGGLRYPNLKKTDVAAGSLDALLAPKP